MLCCQLAVDGLCAQRPPEVNPPLSEVNTCVLEMGQPCLPQVSDLFVVPSGEVFSPMEAEALCPVLFGTSLSLVWSPLTNINSSRVLTQCSSVLYHGQLVFTRIGPAREGCKAVI